MLNNPDNGMRLIEEQQRQLMQEQMRMQQDMQNKRKLQNGDEESSNSSGIILLIIFIGLIMVGFTIFALNSNPSEITELPGPHEMYVEDNFVNEEFVSPV